MDNIDFTETPIQTYKTLGLEVANVKFDEESKEYKACRFDLNGLKVISRYAKITPKKVGQFVTFWKRNANRIIEPFNEEDKIDFYLVNVHAQDKFGQFIFPKAILIEKGIISTSKKEGKRGFRVYPSWDIPAAKQALKTQKWQLNYFFDINNLSDFKKTTVLFQQFSS